MAADLQDPPETLRQLLTQWEKGAQVVWAVRTKREGESFFTLFFARLYYFIVRWGLGLKQVPPSGADFFLLDREVLQALAQARLRNASLLLLISSLPYRQAFITYTKQERAHGQSGWSLRKKFKLFFDSVTMFTLEPVWAALGLGFILLIAGATLFVQGEGRSLAGVGMALAVLGFLSFGGGLWMAIRLRLPQPEPLFPVEKRTWFKKRYKKNGLKPSIGV